MARTHRLEEAAARFEMSSYALGLGDHRSMREVTGQGRSPCPFEDGTPEKAEYNHGWDALILATSIPSPKKRTFLVLTRETRSAVSDGLKPSPRLSGSAISADSDPGHYATKEQKHGKPLAYVGISKTDERSAH